MRERERERERESVCMCVKKPNRLIGTDWKKLVSTSFFEILVLKC